MKIKNKILLFILILIVLPSILWVFFRNSYLGLIATLYLILLLGGFTYYLDIKKERKKLSVVALTVAIFASLVNFSFLPFISPNISILDVKDNYINSVYAPLPSFSFESADNYKDAVKENYFYLTQEVECKIKFPILPIVNFILIPIKEQITLLYDSPNEEFKDYEINPLIKKLYIKNNKIFIEIKRLSCLNIQESTIAFTYRRKFSSKLKFPVSYYLTKVEGDKFILDISLKNKYPFVIKNLFYLDEDFAKGSGSGLGEFLDSTKYKKTSIFKRDVSAGIAQIDKQGNLFVMEYFPVKPNEDMHFFLEIEKISSGDQTK